MFCVVRAVHKFDFRLVVNETPNKRRPVEGRSCSDIDSCFWQCVFSADSRCEYWGTLHALWRSAAFSWVTDSMSQKYCAKSFFETVPLGYSEKQLRVSEKTFWSLWPWKYLRIYAIPSTVVKPRGNVFEISYEFSQFFESVMWHCSKKWATTVFCDILSLVFTIPTNLL